VYITQNCAKTGLVGETPKCAKLYNGNVLHTCLSDYTIRYDTIEEFNVDWKAEYSALSSTRSQKKKLKQPTPVPL